MSLDKIETVNTDTILNEESDINSKREMLYKTHLPSLFEFGNKKQSNKGNKDKYINIVTNTNKLNEDKHIDASLFHKSKKEKETKNNLFKSTNYAFDKKFGSKHINNEDDIPKKKMQFIDGKKEERTYNKSIEKKKNKSLNYHQIKKEAKIKNSNDNKKNEKNVYISNGNNNNYIGEKILININNLNFALNNNNGSNNITNLKNKELQDGNIYEKSYRLSCIINNSPFISLNIFLKNKKCITSMEPLLGQDKCRFFEKNKNIYKGRNINKLFEKIDKDIFQEIEFEINDKLYEVDPSKIYIGQIYKKDKRFIRDITNLDGNAFLRAFIFNYLEKIISRKDINKLTELLGRIKSGLKSIKIDSKTINKIFSIFKIIVKYLEEDDLRLANLLLIKSFSENYDFDKNLMLYMRQCLSESIKRHYCYFIIDYIKEITPKKYIKLNDKNNKEYFDYELYLKEVINSESINSELQYELLVYYFLAPIFDIDLVIYTDNDTKTNKITFKYSNIPNDDKEILKIELLIKFGNISILYSEDFFKKYESILALKSNEEYPLDKIQIIKNGKNKKCYMCNNVPKGIIEISYKFELICRECLLNIINKIIEKRYILFSDTDNSYFHEEYYCNKINYVINKGQKDSYELDISLNDIKCIFNNDSDISSEIYKKIIKCYKCGKCKKKFENKLYCYSMDKCGHLICSNCLKDYIYKITDEKVVLNIYESKKKEIKYFCPECNEEIYLSKNLINNLFSDDIYINNAEERLIDAAENICCFCEENNIKKIKYKFVIENDLISSNYSEENHLLMHSLCKNCYKKIKAKDLNDSKKIFFCDFCGVNHHYNKIKFSAQKRRIACCSHF